MRFTPMLTIVLTAMLLASTAEVRAADYKVDPVHSFMVFNIRHFNVGNVYGRFNGPTGTIAYDAADPSKTSFTVEVQTDAIDTGNDKRDQHLKSPDFFNAAQFPTLSFKSTKVEAGDKDRELKLTGDLSIHGVTKPITVTAVKIGEGKDPQGAERIGFETKFTIKRSDFDMDFMQGAIGDDVNITVALEGLKQ